MEDLVPRIGPYDIWATKWGYTPIAGASTPNDEKPTLDAWAREQDKTPWYRFSTANSEGADPGEETEAVGDADPVKSTTMGMKNLRRVEKLLMPATTWKEGETYDDLNELYGRMISQWQLEMNHVDSVVGGLNSQEKVVGQEGRIFTLIPKVRQEEAVKFLVDNAFATPTWMIDPDILRRIEPVGALTRIRNAQNSVLNTVPQRSALRQAHRRADLGWHDGVHGRGNARDDSARRLERAGWSTGLDRCLPAESAERLPGVDQHEA